MKDKKYVKTYPTQEALFEAMSEYVQVTVRHWDSDFEIDKTSIEDHGDGTYIWFLRECGTHLLHLCGEKAHVTLYHANVIRNTFKQYREFCITINNEKGEYSLSLIADCMVDEVERQVS